MHNIASQLREEDFRCEQAFLSIHKISIRKWKVPLMIDLNNGLIDFGANETGPWTAKSIRQETILNQGPVQRERDTLAVGD